MAYIGKNWNQFVFRVIMAVTLRAMSFGRTDSNNPHVKQFAKIQISRHTLLSRQPEFSAMQVFS